ncbi:unnamed protein product, partial [Prorocentrum cordatum]
LFYGKELHWVEIHGRPKDKLRHLDSEQAFTALWRRCALISSCVDSFLDEPEAPDSLTEVPSLLVNRSANDP